MNTGSGKDRQEKPIVLVVDGDIERRFCNSVYLMRLEYHVFSVGSVEDALAVMRLTVPRIVITGLSLPGMTCIDLLQRLKQDPRTRQVPVLVYTAIRDPASRRSCEQAGCSGYVVQTDDLNELYEAVQKATEPAPRHFVRLSTWLDVAMTGPGGGQVALVTAISEQGMFVNTTQPMPYGATAEFTLSLPKLVNRGIRITGKVLYSYGGGGDKITGMGVKFLKLSPEDNLSIKTFIREKLSEGLEKK
jgi:CheY-like chemotaxis protein